MTDKGKAKDKAPKVDQLERLRAYRETVAAERLTPVSSAAAEAGALAEADAESRALAKERARRLDEGREVARRRASAELGVPELPAFAPFGLTPASAPPPIVGRARARGFDTASDMLEHDLEELGGRVQETTRELERVNVVVRELEGIVRELQATAAPAPAAGEAEEKTGKRK